MTIWRRMSGSLKVLHNKERDKEESQLKKKPRPGKNANLVVTIPNHPISTPKLENFDMLKLGSEEARAKLEKVGL